MKKRLLSLLLVFCMVFSLVPTTAFAVTGGQGAPAEQANPFNDVKETDWFYDAVQYVRVNGFFNGTSKTTFAPGDAMTRGMFVTVLGRMAGVDETLYRGGTAFEDVPQNAYYAPYVAWAVECGITTGTGAKTFSPDAHISREQMALFFVRYFELFGMDYDTGAEIATVPADLNQVSAWAKDAVLKLWKQGLLNGDGTNFNPAGDADRAQVAAICMRTDKAIEVWYSAPGVIGREHQENVSSDPVVQPATPNPGSDIVTYSVLFYDGSRLIEAMTVLEGEPLNRLPSNEKTSKATGVFVGWYADPTFTTPFYADVPITADTKVYAKYTELGGSELTLTSFAQMDLTENASFVVRGSGNISAITLTPMDGSVPVELAITSTADGYIITAAEGFRPGASYELTIPEGMNFVGSTGEILPETIRTASFSIEREEVQNIQMSDLTHFVQHANPAVLHAGSVVTVAGVNIGDLICFYHTTNPEERDYTTSVYADDPETWFKAASVYGDKVTLAELEDADTEKMYDVPDNFPVIGDPTAVTGTLTLAADGDGYTLDEEVYAMMLAGDASITADLAYAQSKISVGDFVSIYVSSDSIESEGDVYFGKITAYDAETGTIIYTLSSSEEIQSAVDLYVKPALEGDDMISEEAKTQIEQIVLAQVQESGFAEEAAFLLADLATQTNGFRDMDGVQMFLTDENGEPLSDEEIDLLNLGASFELSDDIELTVEIITSGDQLHFEDEGSVQLAVGIDAQFEVEVEDDGKICIDLSAVFVQELAIGLSANGELVWKTVAGFIPVPLGVKVGATFDLYSYTGVRVDVQAYTVAPEDESLFDQFKDVISNPEKLADVLPDDFAAIKEGLETVGDVFDKIEELEGKIAQAQEDAETALGYAEDLADLWAAVDAMDTDGKYSKEDWQELCATFGKTNVSGDLMEMLNISTETELDADRYAESLEDLLAKYGEMLEKETDWVTLIEQEIGKFEYNFYGLVLFMKADFLVHTDINIAMGANLQYEVGKRYNFWLKIGLFKPEAGSSTMDLMDEQFAFQFYVMGKLGMKMGIKGSAGFAIGTADVASVALAIEVGPYVKLYGFFIYEYERMRVANSSVWLSDERMAGALYLDFGLYMVVSLEAEALGLFEVSCEIFDEEFPLLEAGNKKYPYEFHYKPEEDELVLVQDVDGNSTNGITMELPEEYRALSYCNLVTGYMGATAFDWDDYNIYLSNPAFSIDANGVISVNVPEDTRYIECDMVLTYKYGKMAFSTFDMQVTIPLVWTNLSLDEITQYYTASVRVGNVADGYDIVWSQKVRKNEGFTLPTMDELKELIGYDNAIYASISYPDAGLTTNIIANTSYDCTVAYTQYAVTVNGIQNADGSISSRTFYTTYGETFDFTELEDTGTEIENTTYTKFANVTTEVTVTAHKQTQVIDLTKPITGKVAEAVLRGIDATANYVDDSALVTYVFTGIDVDPLTERIRKGDLPAYDIYAVAADNGMAVENVTPELGVVNGTTTYYVECGDIVGESYTLYFEENGGAEVENIIRVGGSLVGTLPVPTREGYTFAGWYADETLTTEPALRLMPKGDVTVYAKWTANEYTVNFHVNGGNSWIGDEGAKVVIYDTTYGELPVPTRDGYGFMGWYTDTEYTTEVTADSIVSFAGAQTLYAKWHKLVEIEKTFAYDALETNPIYSKGVAVEIVPSAWATAPEGAPAIEQSDFTIKFMRQGNNTYEEGYPINAGTYDVTITRPADDYYAPFSQTIVGVLTIDKATRRLESAEVELVDAGYTCFELKLKADSIDDLDPDASVTYNIMKGSTLLSGLVNSGVSSCVDEAVRVCGLMPNTSYWVLLEVSDDSNYYDAISGECEAAGATLSAPTDSWLDYVEPIELVEGTYEYVITTAGQLAWLAHEVKGGNDFEGYVFELGADIDLRDHMWFPIGVREYTWSVGSFLNGNHYYEFRGSFDGNGYTVSGLYEDVDSYKVTFDGGYTSYYYGGLFGLVGGDSSVICNVTLDDAYITGASNGAGGIVGRAYGEKNAPVEISECVSYAYVDCGGTSDVGGIVGNGTYATIKSCVNFGSVKGYGGESGGTGGIVGYVNDSADCDYANVVDCVNYGSVNGYSYHTGGIVGYVIVGRIVNSVNFGTVYGSADCVGGITGEHSENKNAKTMNCANLGYVSGSGNYVGQIIGRNYDNKGTVGPVYYCYTGNASLCAAGTKNGSTDDVKNLTVSYFSKDNIYKKIDSLNSWGDIDDYEGTEWVKDPTPNLIGFIPESVFVLLYEEN